MKENNFGTVISKLRKEKGLTQKDLADELGVSDKAISRWETGKSYPDLEMIYVMSKFFNIPFSKILKFRMEEKDKDDNVVQEIINEFTSISRKNNKKLKILLGIGIFLILFLLFAFIFTLTFNRFKVYRVFVNNGDFIATSGMYVETRIKDTLQLNNIKLKNVEIKNDDIVSVDLYFIENDKENVIQNYSSLDDITFTNFQSYIEIDDLTKYIDNLYLRVTIIDNKNNVSTYETKLEFTLDFSNNKIFYKEQKLTKSANSARKIILSEDEIKEILLENGFVKKSQTSLIKENKKYKIYYYSDIDKINYIYEKDNLSYRYTYTINIARLDVEVFSKNNTQIEKYSYDANTNKVIECITGTCNNYDEAMKLLNRDILDLLYK